LLPLKAQLNLAHIHGWVRNFPRRWIGSPGEMKSKKDTFVCYQCAGTMQFTDCILYSKAKDQNNILASYTERYPAAEGGQQAFIRVRNKIYNSSLYSHMCLHYGKYMRESPIYFRSAIYKRGQMLP
jgi:hypothetical protein